MQDEIPVQEINPTRDESEPTMEISPKLEIESTGSHFIQF